MFFTNLDHLIFNFVAMPFLFSMVMVAVVFALASYLFSKFINRSKSIKVSTKIHAYFAMGIVFATLTFPVQISLSTRYLSNRVCNDFFKLELNQCSISYRIFRESAAKPYLIISRPSILEANTYDLFRKKMNNSRFEANDEYFIDLWSDPELKGSINSLLENEIVFKIEAEKYLIESQSKEFLSQTKKSQNKTDL